MQDRVIEGRSADLALTDLVALLGEAAPVIEYVPGWQCDISGVRKWEDLPKAAQDYVLLIESAIGCRIGYVSVGPERESIILR